MSSDAYKYNYTEKVAWQPQKLVWLLLLLLACGLIVWKYGAELIVACVIAFVILGKLFKLFGTTRTIEITPRYFICGSHVVFYENVRELSINDRLGEMRIRYNDGHYLRDVVLERDKFPTNARKDFKIAANKQEKFNKVKQKLSTYIRTQAHSLVET